MTKAEIVAKISEKLGVDKTEVQNIVEHFMEGIKDSLESGDNVYLRGFGSFIIKARAEKTGRNISKNTTKKEQELTDTRRKSSFITTFSHFRSFKKILLYLN